MRGASSVLRFSKMHGAGNDFVVLDLRNGSPAPDAALCRALADRRAGVGCDQILTIEAPRSADAIAAYSIWNADGSTSQQCGNGARCIADWLVRDGAVDAKTVFMIDSPIGMHAVEALGDGHYRIAMGVPEFAPPRIPLAGFAQAQDLYDIELDAGPAGVRQPLRFGAVSMGNPHAVIVVDSLDASPVATVGAALQSSAWFPQSANVGFAQIVSRDRIRLRVFERGAGETLACGSGACAAAAVLMRRGAVERDVTVSLPGGELRIAWPDDSAQVTMAGPTAFVFEGEWTA